MTDSQALGSGEIGRSLARIEKAVEDLREEVADRDHALRDKITATVGPVSVLIEKVQTAEGDIKELQRDVRGLLLRAAGVSGGVAALAWLVEMFWKH